MIKILVHIERTDERFQQVRLVLHLELRLGIEKRRVARHTKVVTDDGLCPVVDQGGSKEGQMTFVMVGEVFVKEFRGN